MAGSVEKAMTRSDKALVAAFVAIFSLCVLGTFWAFKENLPVGGVSLAILSLAWLLYSMYELIPSFRRFVERLFA
jgi:hypothetical protein